MNNEELIKENQLLKEELEKIKNELIETKEHLKKYTAPIRNKIYYEENKEKHKQKVKAYLVEKDKLNKETVDFYKRDRCMEKNET